MSKHSESGRPGDALVGRAAFPHCDARILHAPGECSYCDKYDDWQELRGMWRIAFTGETPPEGWTPCPADAARPPGSPSDHRKWGGNVARDERDLLPSEWRSYPPLRLNGEDEPQDPDAPTGWAAELMNQTPRRRPWWRRRA